MTTPATGVVLNGRYRLVERIATGGMGTVWAGEDEVLSRGVAVKVLNEALASEPRFAERFRREARAAARLSHPNIAGVFDYGEDDGSAYIVMELIDGETLADRMHREGALTPEETGGVGASVADALAYAHANGIVHRDVKPANVMITPRGEVKVMDFGIAAPAIGATGLTATGAVMGTAKYLSPEQARGDRTTPASDVYALGVVLYEALAGRVPFERETPLATAMAHIREEPVPLSEARPDIPDWLAAVVHRCLAKDPKDRPTDAAAVALALRDAGAAGPATAGAAGAAIPGDGPDRDDTAVLPVAERTEVLTAAEEEAAAPAAVPVSVAPRGGRWKGRRAWWMVLAAVVAVGLVAFALVSSSGGGFVTVPRFEGLTRADAADTAQAAGLVATFSEESTSSGRVISQRPVAGSKVASGSKVYLTLGPAVVTSPPPTTPPPKENDEHGKGKAKGHKEDHGKGND